MSFHATVPAVLKEIEEDSEFEAFEKLLSFRVDQKMRTKNVIFKIFIIVLHIIREN